MKHTNVKQYAQAITLTEQISELQIKKRTLKNKLANLQRKESKSVAYKRKSKQKNSVDGQSSKSSQQIDVMLKRSATDSLEDDDLYVVCTKKKTIAAEEVQSEKKAIAAEEIQSEKKAIAAEEVESEQNPNNVDGTVDITGMFHDENQQEILPKTTEEDVLAEKKQEEITPQNIQDHIPLENTMNKVPFLEKTEYLS